MYGVGYTVHWLCTYCSRAASQCARVNELYAIHQGCTVNMYTVDGHTFVNH